MKLSSERVESAAILHLDGRLTVEAGDGWLQAAVDLGTRGGVRHVLVQMRRVGQIDCTGIGQLLRLREQLHSARRSCALVEVAPRQRRLLELAGLHRVFRMFDDCDDARITLGIALDRVAPPVLGAAAQIGFAIGPRSTGTWGSWASLAEARGL
jgi:anti-anti-sigma factor